MTFLTSVPLILLSSVVIVTIYSLVQSSLNLVKLYIFGNY